MIQITFTGGAAEVRQEMLVLLGMMPEAPQFYGDSIVDMLKKNTKQTVDQQVEAAFGEVKRGRGRPRKAVDVPVELAETAKVEAEQTEVVPVEEAPAIKEAPVVEDLIIEDAAPSLPPVPTNAQDLMTATMDLVKGDSGKKIALVKLLGSYGAKTINTLAAEHYPEFWEKVNAL